MPNSGKRRFIFGMVLAWLATAHVWLALSYAFRIVGEERAADPGRPLGYVPLHFTVAMAITAVVGVVGVGILFRSRDGEHGNRSRIAELSAYVTLLTIAVLAVFMWMAYAG
jgi:hypothetical protein